MNEDKGYYYEDGKLHFKSRDDENWVAISTKLKKTTADRLNTIVKSFKDEHRKQDVVDMLLNAAMDSLKID